MIHVLRYVIHFLCCINTLAYETVFVAYLELNRLPILNSTCKTGCGVVLLPGGISVEGSATV